MVPFHVVIPARFASTRLPGKPLVDICGKPMIVRVLERARLSGAESIWVATDHQQVFDVVKAAGGDVLMTRNDHATGTDRLAEVVEKLQWPGEAIVVNVQGDEPLIEPSLISSMAQELAASPEAAIATAAHPIKDIKAFLDPNVVKVICDVNQRALYFSRAPIPWPRDAFSSEQTNLPAEFEALGHIGLYAYRASFLKCYNTLDSSLLEKAESLEQLRALWHGYCIKVKILGDAPFGGVDTLKDLEKMRQEYI